MVDNVMIDTPQTVLKKGSVTFTPSEFFLTPSDIQAEMGAFTDVGGKFDETQKGGVCSDGDAFIVARCLVRGRKRDFFYRGLSGFTGTLSFSENLRVKNNILITAGSDAAGKNNQWSGSVTFSAAGLFQNGGDWESAQKAAALYTGTRLTAYGDDNVSTSVSRELLRIMVRRCDRVINDLYTDDGVDLNRLIDEKCVRRIAGPYGVRAWTASLIPDVTYQVQTQFDFVKSGNTYIQYPAYNRAFGPSLQNGIFKNTSPQEKPGSLR